MYSNIRLLVYNACAFKSFFFHYQKKNFCSESQQTIVMPEICVCITIMDVSIFVCFFSIVLGNENIQIFTIASRFIKIIMSIWWKPWKWDEHKISGKHVIAAKGIDHKTMVSDKWDISMFRMTSDERYARKIYFILYCFHLNILVQHEIESGDWIIWWYLLCKRLGCSTTGNILYIRYKNRIEWS